MSKRLYIVYDARAAEGDTDGAAVMVTCDTLKEAHTYDGDYGAVAVFSYATEAVTLTDKRFEYTWWPEIVKWKK